MRYVRKEFGLLNVHAWAQELSSAEPRRQKFFLLNITINTVIAQTSPTSGHTVRYIVQSSKVRRDAQSSNISICGICLRTIQPHKQDSEPFSAFPGKSRPTLPAPLGSPHSPATSGQHGLRNLLLPARPQVLDPIEKIRRKARTAPATRPCCSSL